MAYTLNFIEGLPDHEAKSIAEVIPGIGPDGGCYWCTIWKTDR